MRKVAALKSRLRRCVGGVLTGLLVAAAAVPLASLAAQDGQERTATLVGLVYDSTSMKPLPGARVVVLGTSGTADADENGRFRIASVPAGTHWVSFFHSRLQTLGVSPPSRQFEFRPGGTVEAHLAVPSEETLLRGWCLAEQPGPRYGAISGVVTDSLTGVPMSRALVTAAPTDRTFGASEPVEVRADDAGYYRMCAVPADQEIRLQAHFGRSSGRSVRLALEPESAHKQDLVLLMSAEGTLTGTVIDHGTGQPVAGASVSVLGTDSRTLTDEQGRFLLDDLPPGRHLVATEYIGFDQRVDSVTVFGQETVTAEVRLATEALEIEGLTVTARSRFGRTSLAADAKRADFITREEIEPLLTRVTHAGDLLRLMSVPGLRIRDVRLQDPNTGMITPGLCVEVSRQSVGTTVGCNQAAVYLNDVRMPYPDQVLPSLDPNIIERIEILSAIDAAFQFGTVAGNGAVLIYTR